MSLLQAQCFFAVVTFNPFWGLHEIVLKSHTYGFLTKSRGVIDSDDQHTLKVKETKNLLDTCHRDVQTTVPNKWCQFTEIMESTLSLLYQIHCY
jgi:hypothetical protein